MASGFFHRVFSPHLGRFGAAAIVAAGGLVSTLPGCSGTSVYDQNDPLECGVGNGCGVVVCSCDDGSYMIDSRCEAGKCLDAAEECKDRCGTFGAVTQVVASEGDTFGMGGCEALQERMLINGCKEGVELFSTECVPEKDCSDGSRAFWNCVVGEAVLSCKNGALRAVGCDVPPPLALCTPPIPQ